MYYFVFEFFYIFIVFLVMFMFLFFNEIELMCLFENIYYLGVLFFLSKIF